MLESLGVNMYYGKSPHCHKFYKDMGEEDRAITQALCTSAWDKVVAAVAEGRVKVLVLDEIGAAWEYNLIDRAGFKDMVLHYPYDRELILTGRVPPPFVLDEAHYITHMVAQRHPYTNGIRARRGVEF